MIFMEYIKKGATCRSLCQPCPKLTILLTLTACHFIQFRYSLTQYNIQFPLFSFFERHFLLLVLIIGYMIFV